MSALVVRPCLVRRGRKLLVSCAAAATFLCGRGAGRVRGAAASELDLDVDPGGEVELHELVDGLRRQVLDVYQPLVGADLKLLAGVLVDVGRPQHREDAPPAGGGGEGARR